MLRSVSESRPARSGLLLAWVAAMKSVLIAAALVMAPPLAAAQEITAVCTYERSVDDTGKSTATAGTFSAKIVYMLPIGQPLNVQVRTTKAPCFDFLATGDEMAIRGVCVRELTTDKFKMEHRFTFDRISGTFEEIVRFNDKGGLVHYGRCAAAKPAL